jgi:hypothetical protein
VEIGFSMSSDWEFVDACRATTRNRLTPPTEVRDLVVEKTEFNDERVYWYYDTEIGLAAISNDSKQDLVSFGYTQLEDENNSVVVDRGLVDAAFEEIEPDTSMVFLGEEGVMNENNHTLYLLHEKQFYDLFPDVDSIKKAMEN